MSHSNIRKAYAFSALVFAVATAFPPDVGAVELSCGLYVKPGTIGFSSNLNRIERNGSMHGVAGAYLVNFDHAAVAGALNAPRATEIASQVSAAFPVGYLQPHSVTEIYVLHSFDQIDSLSASISGKVLRRHGENVIVDFDAIEDFHRVYILDSALDASTGLKKPLPRNLFEPRVGEAKTVAPLKRRKLGPIITGAQKGGTVHVGGLISISAEPPEGFFAAATAAELEKSGWKAAPAADADVWIYRVPDSRPESYFQFNYASPDRPVATPYEKKFKVATGIGPSTHPGSLGGAEADLLWLGDEQMGQINRYLDKISQKDLNLEDLYIERGIVQRVGKKSFVLSGLDHRYALTQAGFDAMETNPELYRRVYDKEYDEFLATLFKDSHPNPNNKSFLLATSRGCSQGCAICCSGGLSQFQYFSAPRMMTELEKLVTYAKLGPSERMNIFLLDSNFNNNPGRVIEFAKLYKESPLYGRFDFFIRHNTVNGFLKPNGAAKIANEELIDAYATLGIKEVFMGIDSFDDASTVTLKTHKFKVAKDGAESRPIYTAAEVTSLINALEKRKLYAKGFFLTNNPWVSDFDRIDSYYNLIDLWLENPHFSIDSARDRNVIRLKPFPGSPIGETSKMMGFSNAKDGLFFTSTPLGQIDEKMEFAGLGRPRQESDTEATLTEFWTGIQRLKADAEKLANSKDAKKREYGRNILMKFKERDAAFARTLNAAGGGGAKATQIGRDIRNFASAHAGLPQWDPAIQKAAFSNAIQSLGDGLKTSLPKKGAALE